MSDWIPPEEKRCQFLWANGNRCRELRAEGEEHGFCAAHFARIERDLRPSEPDPARVAAEILPPDTALDSASAVNAALTRVFRCVCEGRLAPRHANSLGYVGQLIISTLPGITRETPDPPKHPLLGADPDAAISNLAQSLQQALSGVTACPAQAHSAATPPGPVADGSSTTATPSPAIVVTPVEPAPGAEDQETEAA